MTKISEITTKLSDEPFVVLSISKKHMWAKDKKIIYEKNLKNWAREHIKELINKNQKWLDGKDVCIYCNKLCFDSHDDCICFEKNDAIITWIKKNILEEEK